MIGKYHILGRFWVGLGLGSVIGTVVTILISYTHGDGSYWAIMPSLLAFFETEIDAVTVQFLLFALIGVVFAEAGILFSVEKWSFALRCLIHFCITSVFFIPFLWLCYFSQEPLWKLLIMLGNLLFTYVITWLISYLGTCAEVRSINRKIEELRNKKHE